MTELAGKATRTRGEETRERLLAAAYEQFLRHGYHGSSMRQIAGAAGIAVGGIYNHFASKDDIFAAVLDHYHPYHVILPALEQAEGDTMEGLLRTTATRLQAAVSDQADRLMPLVFIELVEFQGRHLTSLADKIVPIILEYLQRFVERSGDLRPIPMLVIQRAFISFMVGHFFTEYILRNSSLFVPQPQIDWFGGTLDVYLRGVLREGADDRRQATQLLDGQ
jgi:AcrR family transcriptional regulator